MKFKITLFIVLGISMLIFACAPKLYVPTAENVAPGADLSQIAQGRTIMTEKCVKCHGLKNPDKHTPDQWVKIMEKMGKKAKLSDNDKALVLKYVTKGVK